MPLQDLTPQLRTRLSRMERAVGLFVMLATALLVFGFSYYLYDTAARRGWFKVKATFYTYLKTGVGLKPGDTVMLTGFEAGRITKVTPTDPKDFVNSVYVEFQVQEPNYGYLWTEGSVAKVEPAGFLSQRAIEVTRGTGGRAIYLHHPVLEVPIAEAGNYSDTNHWRLAEDVYQPGTTQLVARAFGPVQNVAALSALGQTQVCILDRTITKKGLAAMWNEYTFRYEPYTKGSKYELHSQESPAVTEQMQELATRVKAALPGILDLTNKIVAVLSNTINLTSNLNSMVTGARPAVSNLDYVLAGVRPVISNLNLATAHLDQPGALGEWLLPTNINGKLDVLLTGANGTMMNLHTKLDSLVVQLGGPIANLADLTSNLNHQVEMNSNMLSIISKTVGDSDEFVQGLKHHWFLRSAFKTKTTNGPPVYQPVPK